MKSQYINMWIIKGLIIIGFFILPSISSAAVLSRAPNNLGLVGYWSMNEGVGTQAGDSSGKGNHGTFSSAKTLIWTNGKYGKA